MAVGLQNFPNIFSPDGDYLSGRIKDDQGDGLGTPINQMTNGDLQEFFARLMKYAGIEPNDLPDSEYTGHQYIQALVKHLNYKIGKPIVEGLIGGYTTNDLIVLEGVVITISGSTATWTSGYIYYNNLIYFVDAGTLTKSSGVFLYVISDTDNFKISISNGTSGTGIADYGASSVKTLLSIIEGSWVKVASGSLSNGWTIAASPNGYFNYKIDIHGVVTVIGLLTAPSSSTNLSPYIMPFAPSTGSEGSQFTAVTFLCQDLSTKLFYIGTMAQDGVIYFTKQDGTAVPGSCKILFQFSFQ